MLCILNYVVYLYGNQITTGCPPIRVNFIIMLLSFVSSRIASNNVTYNIMLDEGFNQYVVCSQKGTILFKAESESLALYGIRCIGRIDIFGLLITEEGFKHYNGKPYNC